MRKIATLAAVSAFAHANAPAPKADEAKKAGRPKADAAPIVVTGVATLPQPDRAKRGSSSAFPFASLTAVGMAFGVKDRTAKSMSQVISTQNRKHLVDKRDDAGNVVYKTKEITGENGVKTVMPSSEPEKVAGKRFYAVDVTKEYHDANLKGTDLEGSSVLVFREI